MRYAKLFRAISAVSAMLAYPDFSRADFSYNFDNLTGSPTPGSLLVPGSTALGTIGQDNWALASGPSAVVRSDSVTGFSGNYISSSVVANGSSAGVDSIFTRLGANLGLASTGFATFQFDGEVGPGFTTSTGSTTYKRSEMAPGYDANHDGDIRSTSLAAENNEVAFQFGYEATGSGWYVRRTAYSNTATVTALTTATGVYRMQLVVNFDANPVVIGGATYNDGAGTLFVKQLADANGNPVNDVFHPADPTTTNVDLAIATGMGTLNANPALWNGLDARTANNGAIDNIVITTGAPTSAPTWSSGAGNWLSASNWYPTVPNAIGAEADFTVGAKVDSTVYTDSAVTVGTIKFNNTHSYFISGAGSLTLQASTGSGLVDVGSANVQEINLPLTVASNTNFNVISGGTLKISDPMTVNSGVSLAQTGAGTVLYESSVLLQPGASLALGNNTSIHALSVNGTTGAWASTVDVANHTMVLRTGDITQMRDQLKSGYNAGAWSGNGIKSSAAALNHLTGVGYASAASLLGLSGTATATFDGQTVDASSLIAKYAWSGDANLDGKVNTADFMAVANNFGASGKVWQTGDFNYDGVVNALDFNAIATNFGQTSPPATLALGSVVPEPCTVGVLLTAMTGMLIRRRRSA